MAVGGAQGVDVGAPHRVVKGAKIVACSACSFDAAKVETLVGSLFEATCLVCKVQAKWMELECSTCETAMTYEGDDGLVCETCSTPYTSEEVVELIDDNPATPDNYFDLDTPANCSYCDGYHTVVSYCDKYVCTACLEACDALEVCGWCNDGNNGDMEDSSWQGCNHCDGRAGWDRD